MSQKDGELEVSWFRQGLWFLGPNLNLLVQNPDSVPDWLSQGTTTLILKNDKTDQAKNYRPITCLSVFYKTLTSVIRQRIAGHLV